MPLPVSPAVLQPVQRVVGIDLVLIQRRPHARIRWLRTLPLFEVAP